MRSAASCSGKLVAGRLQSRAMFAASSCCVVVALAVATTRVAFARPEATDLTSSYRGVSDGWQVWQVTRDANEPVLVDVRRKDGRLPLVLFAAGSHCVPAFFSSQGGKRKHGTLPFEVEDAQKLASFHFAVVERTGMIPFSTIEDPKAADRCTETHGGVRKSERVEEMAAALSAFRAQPWVSEVLLAGHSEGADVVAGVAARAGREKVAAVGLFSGGGITQFFDFVVARRRTRDAAGADAVFQELIGLTGPSAPPEYRGFPKERFLSYAIESSALDDLRPTDIAVFVAHGTDDANSAVEGADAMVAELLRDRGRSVSYVVLDGLDHGFTDGEGRSHGAEVLAQFVRWATSARTSRDVRTLHFPAHAADSSASHPPVRLWGLPLGAYAIALGALGALGTVSAPRLEGLRRDLVRWFALAAIALGVTAAALQCALLVGVRNRLPVAIGGLVVGTLAAARATRRAARRAPPSVRRVAHRH